MTTPILLIIAFIEGFASLGTEIIALRRLVPYMGSSITVTAPTIGLFLLALAWGYWSGGKVQQDYLRRITRNYLISAGIIGVGLSSLFVLGLFAVSRQQPLAAYLVFMGLVVCPPAWLLAQTVPMLANVIPRERAGAASGLALTASTAGSVLGASVLSLVVMQLWGVSAAVVACCASLCLAPLLTWRKEQPRWGTLATAGLVFALVLLVQAAPKFNVLESAYADYRVQTVPATDLFAGQKEPVKLFVLNQQGASSLDSSTPPKPSPYVERIRALLVDELALKDKNVLVLGAGGFTLSVVDKGNRYTYVDIDPNVRTVAERDFLKAPITGEFIVDDARRFVAGTERRFEAIVVDAFNAHASIPAHLVTLEFWRSLPRALTQDGVVVANLVLDAKLQSAFARNVLGTIEQALGRCTVEVLSPLRPASNVIVSCRPGRAPAPEISLYTDEHNRVDLDRGLMGY